MDLTQAQIFLKKTLFFLFSTFFLIFFLLRLPPVVGKKKKRVLMPIKIWTNPRTTFLCSGGGILAFFLKKTLFLGGGDENFLVNKNAKKWKLLDSKHYFFRLESHFWEWILRTRLVLDSYSTPTDSYSTRTRKTWTRYSTSRKNFERTTLLTL